MATPQDQQQMMGKIIARAWSDPAFKQQLLANPAATLKAEGVEVPAGVEVRAVENSATLWHLVLSPKPAGELSDAELEKVAGGDRGDLKDPVTGNQICETTVSNSAPILKMRR